MDNIAKVLIVMVFVLILPIFLAVVFCGGFAIILFIANTPLHIWAILIGTAVGAWKLGPYVNG